MQYKVTVNLLNGDGQNFHEIFCGHKSETVRHMGPKVCVSNKTHRYYKYSKLSER